MNSPPAVRWHSLSFRLTSLNMSDTNDEFVLSVLGRVGDTKLGSLRSQLADGKLAEVQFLDDDLLHPLFDSIHVATVNGEQDAGVVRVQSAGDCEPIRLDQAIQSAEVDRSLVNFRT